MTRRRTATAWGLAAVAAYVAGAALSGHLSPFARRPLLDGTGPPAPYNWVSPPPALAPTNQPPQSGDYTISLKPSSQAGVFQTNDRQAVLILPQGAIPRSSGATSVALSIAPLDPAKVGALPGGLAVAGNIYLARGVYQPGGTTVAGLAGHDSEVALTYPFTNSIQHVVVQSDDGRTWTKLPSTDSLVNHQVLATRVTRLGYFAVGVPASGSTPTPSPSTSSGGPSGVLTAVIAGVAVVVLLLALRAEFVRRRNAREEGSWRDQPRRRR